MTWMDWQSLHIRAAPPELANALFCVPTVCVCVCVCPVPLSALAWDVLQDRDCPGASGPAVAAAH